MAPTALTRRQLLLASLALAACEAAPRRPAFPFRHELDVALPGGERPPEPSRVLIVGAGIAGLAAANALTTAGIACTVFEARERAGGRIHSVQVGGAPVDVGASWIHEPEGNPLAALCDALAIPHPSFAIDDLIAGGSLWESGPGLLNPLERARTLLQLDGIDFAPLVAARPDADAAAVLAAALEPWRGDPAQRQRLSRLLDVVAQTELAARPGQLAAHALTPPEPYSGGDEVMEGRYARLIDAHLHGLDVRLGTAVRGVTRSASGVELRLADGSVERGSHVLLTVPLGVLKAGALGFEPLLPAAHRDALARVGFGRFEKLVLRYGASFWEEMGSAVLLSGVEAEATPAFIDWSAPAGAPTLVALSAGGFAERFSGRAREQTVAQAQRALRAVFGEAIPAPTAVLATAWAADPFSRGAYSYEAFGQQAQDRIQLGTPVDGRLLFAGEATSLERYATVDGAWSSGLREAARLLGSGRLAITLGEWS